MVEKSVFGLGVAVLGMITVFSGLLILIVFIKFLSASMGKATKKTKEKQPAKAEATPKKEEVPADVLVAITAALAANNETVSPDVVAAISAALNVVMGETAFVVRRIKRIQNASAWNRAGREEQVYSRF